MLFTKPVSCRPFTVFSACAAPEKGTKQLILFIMSYIAFNY